MQVAALTIRLLNKLNPKNFVKFENNDKTDMMKMYIYLLAAMTALCLASCGNNEKNAANNEEIQELAGVWKLDSVSEGSVKQRVQVIPYFQANYITPEGKLYGYMKKDALRLNQVGYMMKEANKVYYSTASPVDKDRAMPWIVQEISRDRMILKGAGVSTLGPSGTVGFLFFSRVGQNKADLDQLLIMEKKGESAGEHPMASYFYR